LSKTTHLETQITDLKEEKEITTSQEKLDFIDDEIFELEDTIKKLNGEK
jgi:hypothetical protein|tara:strand:+ start:330 stop:476 length:147 start_codon:yes stop_codon:yes gene_type:complete